MIYCKHQCKGLHKNETGNIKNKAEQNQIGSSEMKGKVMRNKIRKILCVVLCVGLIAGMTTGCSGTKQASGGKKIIRVALSQSETHPEYTGMEKFKEYVEEKL